MYANAQITSIFPDIVCTGSEVHFCRCPDTGLAQRHCISDSVFLPSSDLSWKADMFRKIKIRKMTLNRALDKYLKTVSIHKKG
ncbi:TPA: hypothetical protein ACH90F_005652, partial [Escherichia coli]